MNLAWTRVQVYRFETISFMQETVSQRASLIV